jgi:hypothetical protein
MPSSLTVSLTSDVYVRDSSTHGSPRTRRRFVPFENILKENTEKIRHKHTKLAPDLTFIIPFAIISRERFRPSMGRKTSPPPLEWLVRIKEIDTAKTGTEPTDAELLHRWNSMTKSKRAHARKYLVEAQQRRALDPAAKLYTPRDRQYQKHPTAEARKRKHQELITSSKDARSRAILSDDMQYGGCVIVGCPLGYRVDFDTKDLSLVLSRLFLRQLLEWDHRIREEKFKQVSSLAVGPKRSQEIAKCDRLCLLHHHLHTRIQWNMRTDTDRTNEDGPEVAQLVRLRQATPCQCPQHSLMPHGELLPNPVTRARHRSVRVLRSPIVVVTAFSKSPTSIGTRRCTFNAEKPEPVRTSWNLVDSRNAPYCCASSVTSCGRRVKIITSAKLEILNVVVDRQLASITERYSSSILPSSRGLLQKLRMLELTGVLHNRVAAPIETKRAKIHRKRPARVLNLRMHQPLRQKPLQLNARAMCKGFHSSCSETQRNIHLTSFVHCETYVGCFRVSIAPVSKLRRFTSTLPTYASRIPLTP